MAPSLLFRDEVLPLFSFTGETAQAVLVAKCGRNLFASNLRKDQFSLENLPKTASDFFFPERVVLKPRLTLHHVEQ
jgi:hypothetical protein